LLKILTLSVSEKYINIRHYCFNWYDSLRDACSSWLL